MRAIDQYECVITCTNCTQLAKRSSLSGVLRLRTAYTIHLVTRPGSEYVGTPPEIGSGPCRSSVHGSRSKNLGYGGLTLLIRSIRGPGGVCCIILLRHLPVMMPLRFGLVAAGLESHSSRRLRRDKLKLNLAPASHPIYFQVRVDVRW